MDGVKSKLLDGTNEAKLALFALRRYVAAAAGFTLAINLLMLVSPLHMIQVYDRVLTSGSVETLLLVTSLAVALLFIYAVADAGRKRVFSLLGRRFGERLQEALFSASIRSSDAGREVLANLGDLATVQKFLGGGGAAPLFDAPYVPLFAVLLFFVHPWLGVIGLCGALILTGLAAVMETATRSVVEETGRKENKAQTFLTGASRQYSAVAGMGMTGRVFARWNAMKGEAADVQAAAGDRSNLLAAVSRSLRQILQVVMLSVGAYLTLKHEVSPGAIIASSIILSRALGPIDQAVGMWSQIVRVRQAWRNIATRLPAGSATAVAATPHPRPEARLILDGLAPGLPGGKDPLLARMTLVLEPGSILVVVGNSGSGKTTLLQTLIGAWPAHTGAVRVGGRDVNLWAPEDRGLYVGYLPQDIELLPGTVRENIARFRDGPAEAVFEALAQVDGTEPVMRLPGGFDTPVGPGGAHISAGQRQLIGLARALYGEPVLIVLDEPTAHLDSSRAATVAHMLKSLKSEGRVMVIATHDMNILDIADQVMSLNNGYAAVMPGQEYRANLATFRRTVSQAAGGAA